MTYLMVVVAAMGEIETRHAHPRPQKLFDDGYAPTDWPKRAYNLQHPSSICERAVPAYCIRYAYMTNLLLRRCTLASLLARCQSPRPPYL